MSEGTLTLQIESPEHMKSAYMGEIYMGGFKARVDGWARVIYATRHLNEFVNTGIDLVGRIMNFWVLIAT